MCMVYYLGTDGEAPLTGPWIKESPAFYVTNVDTTVSEHVKKKLPHRRLLYLGSHEGCGCGFRSYRDGYLMEGGAEEKDVVADHAALAAYLEELPPSENPIQIFGCWSGDESYPVEYIRDIAPSDIIDPQFGFREREILTLNR
jgi:hypothetical protein